ncbi:MAG TPA: WG repeat-containing protein [Propionicimonas sp.]
MKLGGALAAGLLVLTGCVGPGTSSPPPSASTTPAPTAGAPAASASPSVSAPASPTAATSAPGTAIPDYAGARPMPASDSGPMLWPTSTTMTVWADWTTEITRYGFVSVTGTRVLPPRYEGYDYCRDRAGRVSFVLAFETGRKAVVLDLTGKVVAHAPTRSATCGPVGDVVFSTWFDAELGHHKDGLLDVGTGKILLPLAPGRHIETLGDGVLANVSELRGEYFFNPRSGKRTPHPGWVTEAGLEPGAPGLPATTVKPDGEVTGSIGYVGLSGTWVAKPEFVEASAFRGGHAVVKLAENRYTFLDTRLRRVGDEWTGIEPVDLDPTESGNVAGYLVSGPEGQALLGTDLRTIIAPGSGTIECLPEADGACSVLGTDGRRSLVVLPKGKKTAMPDGFVHALSPSFVADGAQDGGNVAKRIQAIGSGGVAQLDKVSTCNHVGKAWVACDSPSWGVLPPIVVDAKGRRTAFATIEPVLDPVGSAHAAYYWAVAGRYQGFIDDSGNWRYRESRYTRVEE